ncbi:UxaA family hydrolase [Paracoccus sp. Z330]|uniref:UxaA family hydrolase n=1 Tax=Paracoccus onchidii TaxID=3017813 RepID=A0ABT4ZIC8_9RHOB|nr:UxaA family hydrolase [Paracoccus onchidii]MDB6179110.1 UxaA family hydrolase [Paracoccus onchidii]
MTIPAYQIHPDDMVAYMLREAPRGATVATPNRTLLARADIPVFHKIALHDIAAGDTVWRGGWPIGHATRNIPAGAHVHTHNLASAYSKTRKIT